MRKHKFSQSEMIKHGFRWKKMERAKLFLKECDLRRQLIAYRRFSSAHQG